MRASRTRGCGPASAIILVRSPRPSLNRTPSPPHLPPPHRYRPSVPLAFVAAELAYPSLAECRRVLEDAGAVITGDDGEPVFDTKASAGRIKLKREKTAEERVQEALLRAQRGEDVDAGDDDEEEGGGAGDDDGGEDGGDG